MGSMSLLLRAKISRFLSFVGPGPAEFHNLTMIGKNFIHGHLLLSSSINTSLLDIFLRGGIVTFFFATSISRYSLVRLAWLLEMDLGEWR